MIVARRTRDYIARMPGTLKNWLDAKSHSPPFLWKMVIAIIAIGLLASIITGILVRRDVSVPSPETLESVDGEANVYVTDPTVLMLLRIEVWATIMKLSGGTEASHPPPDRGQVEFDTELCDALQAKLTDKPVAVTLDDLALRDPPPEYLPFAQAIALQWEGDLEAAASLFEQSAKAHDFDTARIRAVHAWELAQNEAELRRLADDPAYENYVDSRNWLFIAAKRRDWPSVFVQVPGAMVDRWKPLAAIFAGVCGLIWLTVIMQMFHVAENWRWSLPLAVVALVLGALSVWPTLFLVLVEDELWGISERRDLFGILAHFIIGVGVREELCKLLLFAPLLPLLLKWKNEYCALIFGALVGLGFAIEENMSYFELVADAALGRMLTANFFHAAATGLASLWLYRGIRRPRNDAGHAFTAIMLVILAHGLYDALLSMGPWLGEAAPFAAIAVLIVLAQQFFRELRYLRPAKRDTISLSATLLFGVCVLFSMVMVLQAMVLPLNEAIAQAGFTAVAQAVIVYLYLREMPGSMVTV